MEDYSEWLEATLGTDALGDAMDEDAARQVAVQEERRDAVLCLVDCQLGMFQQSGDRKALRRSDLMGCAAPTAGAGHKTAAGEEKEGTASGSTMAHNSTPFWNALCSVLKLYQDKLITSDKDMIALALYNTRMGHNVYNLSGLYIFHHFAPPDVQSVEKVDRLAEAGNVFSVAYEEFKESIGHAPENRVCLSDVLRASHHMFLSLHTCAIKYRRIFIFTGDDEPHRGDMVEMELCLARVRDLHGVGVSLEVFAVGEHRDATATEAGGADCIDATFPASDGTEQEIEAMPRDSMWDNNTKLSAGLSAGRRFDSKKFWGRLRGVAHGGQEEFEVGAVDAVRVNSDAQELHSLLDAVRQRTHPRRAFQDCLLTIGVSTDGSPVPTMAVSVYHPLLPASLPRARWMDSRTNTFVSRQMQFVAKLSSLSPLSLYQQQAGEKEKRDREVGPGEEGEVRTEEEIEVPVSPDKLRRYTVVGARSLFFTSRECQHFLTTATAGAPIGFSIICFKRAEDILRHKHVIRKSTFLHPNPHDGGEASLRLFLQLTQALVRQNKVAVAQYVARRGAAPRLVALAPSPSPASVPTRGLPVEGLGLYVVPLPYAEDIRGVPSLPCFDPATLPSPQDIATAERVVSALSVSYDINAVSNPSLQLRYQTLHDAKLQHTTPVGRAEPGETVKKTRPLADTSLPDREGMARHAQLFREFNATLLSPSYDADRLCPQPKTNKIAGAKTLRAENGGGHCTGDGGSGDDASVRMVEVAHEQNAIQTLTVAQLKAYLNAVGESSANARRKDEIIEFVTRVLLKRQKP